MSNVHVAESTSHSKPSVVVKGQDLRWDVWVGLIPLMALSPLLLPAFTKLSQHGFRQFFPVVWLVVLVWMAVNGWRCTGTRDPFRRRTAVAMFGLAAVGYATCVSLWSGWLALLCTLILLAAWGLGRLGEKHWASVAAGIALLGTSVPWPWSWDQRFSY